MNGIISDGGVIEHTKFYSKLKNGSLNIPDAEILHDTDQFLNYVFVGDEAFALIPIFLKPFQIKES